MPEILLHYIWQQCLWAGFPQQTTDGQPVEILSVGIHNGDAGPDFLNARLRIGAHEWCGNVEIHLSSSDWYTHRHHLDPAYDRVILHVVRRADKKVYNSRGEEITQCELRYPEDTDYLTALIRSAQRMDYAGIHADCQRQLLSDPDLLTEGWKRTLLRKRLECKRQSVLRLLDITHGSWEQAFYITLAHNFGFHTNGIPFESVAIQTPLSCLQKHRNSLFQLTAILLGQSGLLTEDRIKTDEDRLLLREYRFLQRKFSLVPIDAAMWKYARMRPQTFPEVRLRQFAQLIHQSEFLFSTLMDARDITACAAAFALANPPLLGKSSVNILIINTVLPYQYAFALWRHSDRQAENAYALMEQIPPEDNRIIRQWKEVGQQVRSAADTQALLHLYQNYCQPHNCLNCEVGYQIFQSQSPTRLFPYIGTD